MIAGPSLDQQVRRERGAVDAGATPCGYTCTCHGGYVCIRLPHPDVDGDRVPHVAELDGGGLVQWTGPCPGGVVKP